MKGYEEILTAEEVVALTGRSHRAAQVEWLSSNGWKFVLNAANAPIIGRWYARVKLAGIDMANLTPGILPDFSKNS